MGIYGEKKLQNSVYSKHMGHKFLIKKKNHNDGENIIQLRIDAFTKCLKVKSTRNGNLHFDRILIKLRKELCITDNQFKSIIERLITEIKSGKSFNAKTNFEKRHSIGFKQQQS